MADSDSSISYFTICVNRKCGILWYSTRRTAGVLPHKRISITQQQLKIFYVSIPFVKDYANTIHYLMILLIYRILVNFKFLTFWILQIVGVVWTDRDVSRREVKVSPGRRQFFNYLFLPNCVLYVLQYWYAWIQYNYLCDLKQAVDHFHH